MTARDIAKLNGSKTYVGVACKREHSGLRYTVNADCVECAELRQKTAARQKFEAQYRKTKQYQNYQKAYQKTYAKSEAYKAQKTRYAQKNKGKIAAKTKKYTASKLKRTPHWLTEDDFWMIEQAYELAQQRSELFKFPWDVDHVIPLQGVLVSGLHTPYNLQVIPARDNRSKSNRFVQS
jgi:hypothetical protein